jgi:hypothetical protein
MVLVYISRHQNCLVYTHFFDLPPGFTTTALGLWDIVIMQSRLVTASKKKLQNHFLLFECYTVLTDLVHTKFGDSRPNPSQRVIMQSPGRLTDRHCQITMYSWLVKM